MQFNNTPLVLELDNYATKIANVCIVYDLDKWPKNHLRNFTLKNGFFGAFNTGKHNDNEKDLYSGYEIAFDWKSSWSFNDEFARNVKIFGVDNSSSSQTDNLKHDFVISGEGDNFKTNGSLGEPEKNLMLILVKQWQSFVWICIIMLIIVIYL